MAYTMKSGSVLGMLRPLPDAHTLGMGSMGELLRHAGVRHEVAGHELAARAGAGDPSALEPELAAWIRGRRVNALAMSWRLDPENGARLFAVLIEALDRGRLLAKHGGPIQALYFAGLPPACDLVQERFPWVSGLFRGDESPAESLSILGINPAVLPEALSEGLAYDEDRLAFGRSLIASGEYKTIQAHHRDYPLFGKRGDRMELRVAYHRERSLGPLLRAHVGPYLPDRREAVAQFADWSRRLAKEGLLDVLSIGSSQLTQEAFGQDWGERPNGGGVPINSEEELEEIWLAARPMLVRAYSGVTDTAGMARILEKRLDIAWHALSFWWFCALDGRGPMPVRENLEAHFDALDVIAQSGKPFEPNVPHHFAFRGADDLSYVVSGYVAARAAKERGIKSLVLQIMLNTPKYTHGLADLAKARALLTLARELEGPQFRVYLQPRGGLDYFSHHEDKAKAQLAAVSAMMDDIEPDSAHSPDIIHVVSWSEGIRLADPEVVNESLRITRAALSGYRAQKRERGGFAGEEEVRERTRALLSEARILIAAMEKAIPDTYSPSGLYGMLKGGWFALPFLSELCDEFSAAAAMRTAPQNGGVSLVDADGKPISAAERIIMAQAGRHHG